MSRPANPLRGECAFAIAGQHYTLRPSFENLVAIEEEIGSLFALVERASDGSLALREVTALVWHCLEADPRPAREAVGEAILEAGLVAALGPVRTILGQVLQGRS
ncbi:gene transfer agent family protein [Erythrobacter sp.]|jgi:hypothetical protein|uniref:gene transfer agent family protein n=1 Tax=Erythrobacter sp. TaxID=1042 RepID=UPI002E9A27F2|nr:gene transfer agent family protein [Erythrobacter sp.]